VLGTLHGPWLALRDPLDRELFDGCLAHRAFGPVEAKPRLAYWPYDSRLFVLLDGYSESVRGSQCLTHDRSSAPMLARKPSNDL